MAKSVKSVVEFPAIRTSKFDLIVLWTLAVLGSQEAMDRFLRGVAIIIKKWTWKSDDAFQEAMIATWQSVAKFNPSKASLSSWLRQMARKGWLYATRKGGNEVLFSLLDGADEEFVEQIPSLDKEVQLREEMEAVCGLLDEKRQNILSWYFLEGMNFQEIGEKLGCTKAHARNQVLSIVNLCRKHFGTKGECKGVTKHGMTVIR